MKIVEAPRADAPMPEPGDLAPRLASARLILDGEGAQLYDLDRQHAAIQAVFDNRNPSYVEPYLSPPFVGLLYVPLAKIPYNVASLLWIITTVVLVVISLWLLRFIAPLRWSILFFASSWPTFELVFNRQDSAIGLVLLAGGFRLLAAKRDGWAGAVLAFGLYKPQIFLLIPVLLLCQRRYRAFIGYVVVASTLGVLSVVIVGTDGIVAWLGLLRSPLIGNAVQSAAWHQLSLAAFARGILASFPDAIPFATVALALGVLVVFVRSFLRAPTNAVSFPLLFSLAIVGSILATPYVFVYDGVVLAIPAAIAVRAMPESSILRWSLVASYLVLWSNVPRNLVFGAVAEPASLLAISLVPISLTIFAIVMLRRLRSDNATPRVSPSFSEIKLTPALSD